MSSRSRGRKRWSDKVRRVWNAIPSMTWHRLPIVRGRREAFKRATGFESPHEILPAMRVQVRKRINDSFLRQINDNNFIMRKIMRRDPSLRYRLEHLLILGKRLATTSDHRRLHEYEDGIRQLKDHEMEATRSDLAQGGIINQIDQLRQPTATRFFTLKESMAELAFFTTGLASE